MSEAKTRQMIGRTERFFVVLLFSLLVSACRSVRSEAGEQEGGEPQSAPEQTGQNAETGSGGGPKRRTVLIDADSFSPGAYLPFNASCFDCFLFPAYDVNGV